MYQMANSEKISLRSAVGKLNLFAYYSSLRIDSKFYNKDLTDKTMMGKKLREEIPLPDQDYDPNQG